MIKKMSKYNVWLDNFSKRREFISFFVLKTMVDIAVVMRLGLILNHEVCMNFYDPPFVPWFCNRWGLMKSCLPIQKDGEMVQ